MGRSSKRKSSKRYVGKIYKKLRKLERELEYIESSSDSDSSSASSYSVHESSGMEEMEADVADQQNCEFVEVSQILGENPLVVNKEGPPIHEEIATRWTAVAWNGISKETRDELISKHAIIKNCAALSSPKLNDEVQACLSDNQINQDNFIKKIQDQLASGLSALAVPLNDLFSRASEENNALLANLVDAGKLLTDVQHSLSLHRRFVIMPSLNPLLKKTIISSKIDNCLFGEKLQEVVKNREDVKKTSATLKLAKLSLPKKPAPSTSQYLNYKRPQNKVRFKKEEKEMRRQPSFHYPRTQQRVAAGQRKFYSQERKYRRGS